MGAFGSFCFWKAMILLVSSIAGAASRSNTNLIQKCQKADTNTSQPPVVYRLFCFERHSKPIVVFGLTLGASPHHYGFNSFAKPQGHRFQVVPQSEDLFDQQVCFSVLRWELVKFVRNKSPVGGLKPIQTHVKPQLSFPKRAWKKNKQTIF